MRTVQRRRRIRNLAIAILACVHPVAFGVAGQKAGNVVTLSALSSRAPSEWKPVAVTGQFRHAQFVLPRVDGDGADAELIVFHFGAAGGGGPEANVARWKGMFQDAESKTEQFTVAEAPVTYVDITGTYMMRMRPFDPNEKPQLQPNSRMLAVVFENPGGPYYMRLVGPAKTVAHHKKAFDQWLRSFKPAKS
jgi:hypothetical protein